MTSSQKASSCRTAEVQSGRTPEKCVLFENLFLGALLAFLSQFVQEGKKKLEGRKEGKKNKDCARN